MPRNLSLVCQNDFHPLPDLASAHELEGNLVQAAIPVADRVTAQRWERRLPLGELIRPESFNGGIEGIQAASILNPYRVLQELEPKSAPRNPEWGLEHTVGIKLVGQMVTGPSKRPIGAFEALVIDWQMPRSNDRGELGYYRRIGIVQEISQAAIERLLENSAKRAMSDQRSKASCRTSPHVVNYGDTNR